jgi:hypothetical protein
MNPWDLQHHFPNWEYHGEKPPPVCLGCYVGVAARPHANSAIIVVEKILQDNAIVYACNRIQRIEPGKTAYAEMVSTVQALVAGRQNVSVVVDTTAADALADLFHAAADDAVRSVFVVVAGTLTPTFDERNNLWHLPPRRLVGVLDGMLRDERLKIADQLPDAKLLVTALETLPATNQSAWGDGADADLSLALALAAWAAWRDTDGIPGVDDMPISFDDGRRPSEGMPRSAGGFGSWRVS